jgi:hypothetical protein
MVARWSRTQKVAIGLGGLVLVAAIVGLGWLQVVVMSSP